MGTLVADGERAREGGADRKVVDVAVGILLQPEGAFLLTSRPVGKVYEGYWEFPGGKLEAGETVEQALRRGDLQMREGQSFAWQVLPVTETPVLPGTVPVLAWLAEERSFSGHTHG